MPIYAANGNFGPAVNISAFVANAVGGGAGPTPSLGVYHGEVNLGVGATAVQNIDGAGGATRAIGLLTCASVIYASTDPLAPAVAYVHHANAGHVAAGNIAAALAAVGGAPGNVIVVFAHPGASDPGYLASIAAIIAAGVPANHIVEFPNLPVGQFGVNSLGQIGF